MTVGINDPQIQQIIEDANRSLSAVQEQNVPDIELPVDTVFRLASGYVQENGKWVTEFEVRELTGRDEEALSRISDVGRSLTAMMERGLVRLGEDQATPERLNRLPAGDWDTILLALRAVTFGPEMDINPTCTDCRSSYDVTIDILKDIPVRNAKREDLSWVVKGRKHVYEVSLYTGSTQRRVFDLLSDGGTVATLNTEILHDSIDTIDDIPVLSKDSIRDISMADRRTLLDSIQEHRVGPNLQEVKIKCPTCGHEQPYPLTTAALFRWN